MGRTRSFFAATACAATVAGLAAAPAVAGEITGNGTYKGVNSNASACAFSGQEDRQWYNDDEQQDRKDPADVVKGDPAHSQNWGHVKQAAGLTGGAGPAGCNKHVGEE
jgi:hypothetical protein